MSLTASCSQHSQSNLGRYRCLYKDASSCFVLGHYLLRSIPSPILSRLFFSSPYTLVSKISLFPFTMNSSSLVGFNATLLNDTNLCTLSTCPLSLANQDYVPTLAGNVLYAAIFGILLLIQLFFGFRYRTWGYLVGMFGGLLLEILGYIGRIQMHSNPFTQSPFLLYVE